MRQRYDIFKPSSFNNRFVHAFQHSGLLYAIEALGK